MRDALEAERGEVGESLSRSCRVQLRTRTTPPKYRGNLQIDQLGGAEMLTAQSFTGAPPSIAIVDQRCSQHAGVDDDHLESRSERMARTASAALSLPPV